MQKESVKIERTVYVDHKLKKIYHEYDEYQEVKETDQDFFDWIFPILWLDGHLDMPNKYLAERFGYSISTVEKTLRRLERAHLIYRNVLRHCNDQTGKWETKRDIFLDSVFQTRLASALKLVPAGFESKKKEEFSSQLEKVEESPALASEEKPLVTPKKKVPKFNFDKLGKR